MNMKRVIVKGPDFCAVTEDGILVEYIPVCTGAQSGVILLGRVNRLMPGMKCAFVDIGKNRSGFLPLDEESKSFTGGKVRSGEKMILQIKKEETGEKGAYLTRDVTLPGKNVILMPLNRYIGVSNRITDPEARDRLRRFGEETSDGRFGMVLRNAATNADSETIRQETEILYELWLRIEKSASYGGMPGTVLFSRDQAERLKDDYEAGGIEEFIEADAADPLIITQLKQAANRTMKLPGGGNIVIDRCEAMTVIDVNTASSNPLSSKERTVTETNLEACSLIAQQVRLRNLSGIILIDFIDMEEETDRSLVMKELNQCFSRDRVKTVIHGWTKLGIMEMTRKRTRAELQV